MLGWWIPATSNHLWWCSHSCSGNRTQIRGRCISKCMLLLLVCQNECIHRLEVCIHRLEECIHLLETCIHLLVVCILDRVSHSIPPCTGYAHALPASTCLWMLTFIAPLPGSSLCSWSESTHSFLFHILKGLFYPLAFVLVDCLGADGSSILTTYAISTRGLIQRSS